jgi:uncharacterized protein YbaP (TraB family)
MWSSPKFSKQDKLETKLSDHEALIIEIKTKDIKFNERVPNKTEILNSIKENIIPWLQNFESPSLQNEIINRGIRPQNYSIKQIMNQDRKIKNNRNLEEKEEEREL